MSLTWIEINQKALLSNLRIIRSYLSPNVQVMAMVKANAYGHDLSVVAPILAQHVAYFGVNTLSEALTLRHLNISTPILIAGPIDPSDFPLALSHQVSLAAISLEYLKKLASSPFIIHLKINTGMNRLGLLPSQLPKALDIIHKSPLQLTGIYTHFHSSDSNTSSTHHQLSLFQQTVSQAKEFYPHILAHCANSAVIFTYPQSHLDLVRPGLALYGLYPHPKLQPVLSWYCHPVQSRKITPKDSVGYSATYHPRRSHFISTLPVGYFDGIDRKFSNNSHVYAANQLLPIIGRVAMDYSTINTGSKLLSPATKVELLGSHVTASYLARRAGTISYEIVSRISPVIPRILV